MHISLVVTTFNRPQELLLVLKSIERQKLIPTEVIIADDGSDDLTKKVISNYCEESKLQIIHSFQENLGFRAAESRNKAVAKSSCEFIILIDGDMILHPEFVKDHVKNARKGCFIQGSRVLLTELETQNAIKKGRLSFNFFSKGINNRLNSIKSNYLSKFFSVKKNHLNGIKSCNMSFFLKDFIGVNGFNNEFRGWGREDSEFVVRLMNNNINRISLKFAAVQFHLWHNESSRKALSENNNLLQKAIDKKLNWCDKGFAEFYEDNN
jgi:glycosyltransferase involved in cell wall biosynthesis